MAQFSNNDKFFVIPSVKSETHMCSPRVWTSFGDWWTITKCNRSDWLLGIKPQKSIQLIYCHLGTFVLKIIISCLLVCPPSQTAEVQTVPYSFKDTKVVIWTSCYQPGCFSVTPLLQISAQCTLGENTTIQPTASAYEMNDDNFVCSPQIHRSHTSFSILFHSLKASVIL